VIRVLATRIDTLEASFRGELKPGLAETLERVKREAQAEEVPQSFVIGDTELFVQPKGLPPWPFVLTNEELHLRLGDSARVPCASVRLSAFGLALKGHEALWAEAETLAQAVGATQSAISRLDLAVDFQGHVPTYQEMHDVTCASPWRVVYPNTEHPETFQFGKGPIVVRVYNKTREIASSGKLWMQELWNSHPDYRPDEDVWRVEVQYRREILRRFNIISVEHALERLEGLFAVGLFWVEPRLVSESNLSRCEVQGWWLDLRSTFASEPLPRVKEQKRVAGFAVLLPQMLGLLVSASANMGVYTLSEAAGLQVEAFRSYIADHGKSFEERVRERQRLLTH
jgi:hypothetical protein